MQETNGPLCCTQCGKNISGLSRFCDHCGTPVRPMVQQPVQPQATHPRAVRSSNTTHTAVIVFLVVVALFVVVIFVIAPKGADIGSSQPKTDYPETGVSDEYCKNFPFDEKCPNHKQYKSPNLAHQPDQLHPDGDSTLGCLQMVRKSGETDESFTYVRGTVKNICGRDFSYVEVSFKLLDRDGNVVGTAIANQTNLKNGETWKFQAMGTPAAHHDRFEGVSAY